MCRRATFCSVQCCAHSYEHMRIPEDPPLELHSNDGPLIPIDCKHTLQGLRHRVGPMHSPLYANLSAFIHAHTRMRTAFVLLLVDVVHQNEISICFWFGVSNAVHLKKLHFSLFQTIFGVDRSHFKVVDSARALAPGSFPFIESILFIIKCKLDNGSHFLYNFHHHSPFADIWQSSFPFNIAARCHETIISHTMDGDRKKKSCIQSWRRCCFICYYFVNGFFHFCNSAQHIKHLSGFLVRNMQIAPKY